MCPFVLMESTAAWTTVSGALPGGSAASVESGKSCDDTMHGSKRSAFDSSRCRRRVLGRRSASANPSSGSVLRIGRYHYIPRGKAAGGIVYRLDTTGHETVLHSLTNRLT